MVKVNIQILFDTYVIAIHKTKISEYTNPRKQDSQTKT